MSRVMWGVVTKDSLRADDGGTTRRQQTTLDHFVTSAPNMPAGASNDADEAPRPLKRPREDNNTAAQKQWLQMQHLHVQPDDGILFGPSGGGNRETQNRRRVILPPAVPAMPNLASTSAAPYSRANIAAVREARQIDGAARGPSSATTEFDEALLEAFLPDERPEQCPRDVLRGCCFFLNSCDADPMITTYLLEKLLRRLGGVTSMSAGGVVSYVVTQHLSSAKEIKIVGRGGTSSRPPSQQKHIHPHWILACAKAGRKVPEEPFMTVRLALGASSSNVANDTTGRATAGFASSTSGRTTTTATSKPSSLGTGAPSTTTVRPAAQRGRRGGATSNPNDVVIID